MYVEGSFSNFANQAVPNPNPYPNECTMGKFFAKKGYAFLAIVRRGYKPSTGMNEMVFQATTTKTGLKVRCRLDERGYATGRRVSDTELAAVNLVPDKFHGEWNYTIQPEETA